MNHDAIEQLYERYYHEIYLYAYSLCRNHHIAQEVTSDTFFKAFVSIDESGDSVKFWLLRVCKNCVIDRWRKSRRLSDLSENEGSEDGDNPSERIIQNETYLHLYQAILTLPALSQEVIFLFYFSGLSGEQIAKTIGRSPGAVRTLLYRARIQLKEQLKEESE